MLGSLLSRFYNLVGKSAAYKIDTTKQFYSALDTSITEKSHCMRGNSGKDEFAGCSIMKRHFFQQDNITSKQTRAARALPWVTKSYFVLPSGKSMDLPLVALDLSNIRHSSFVAWQFFGGFARGLS